MAHVGGQVGQRQRQVGAVGCPAAQVLHGEAVTQRVDVRAARREMGDVRVGEVAAEPVVDRGFVGRCGRVAGVEQVLGRSRVGVRGRDVALQGGGEACGEDPPLSRTPLIRR